MVPAEYIELFNERYVGYLMRSERSFDDVHAMLGKYQLSDVVDHDYDMNALHEHVKMKAYLA